MDYKSKFISIFSEKISREGSKNLLDWMESTDFFTAPASTKFHGAKESGLVEHSVKVYEILREKHFDETETLEAQLFNKIKTHDYLYLHFPDSNSITLNKSFFKRIKAELIYFLKQINSALL